MKRLLIALLVFLPFQVEASGLQASFTGSNLSLKRASTRCEYDGSVTPAGALLDRSGYARDLTAVSTPTSITSALQDSSGRRYIARNFVAASSQTYSLVHATWMNMFSTNFTITMVVAPASTGAGADDLFDHLNGNNGIYFYITAGHIITAKLYNGTDATTVTGPSVTVRDGSPHVIQIVRSGNFVTIFVDGTPGATTTVRTADGNDTNATFYLWGSGGAYLDGYGSYFRLDAEALSNERLAYERDQLMGLGIRVGTADAGWFAPASAGVQIPSSGFSRASAATSEFSDGSIAAWDATASRAPGTNIPRVAGSGGGVLIEGQRTNLIHYSQNMGVEWTGTNATVAATSVVLPDGTTGTANTLNTTNKGAGEPTAHYIIANNGGVNFGSTLVTYTTSVWLKKPSTAPAARNWVRILVANTGGTSPLAYFNTSTCAPGSVTNGTSKAVQYPNGWCRVSITGQCVTAMAYIFFDPVNADGDTDISATGTDDLHIYGLQVEAGTFASSYIPTTSAAVIRYADNLITSPVRLGTDLTLGTEKMWYDFSSDPAGHTNLILQSQTYGTTWTPIRATISENTALALAPDGTQTADILVEDGTAGATHYVGQSVATVTGTTYTFSVILKAASRSWTRISANTDSAEANFNLGTGEIGTITAATAVIKPLSSGWYRCSVTWASVTTGSQSFRIYGMTSNSGTAYDGVNGTNALYLWGSQLEASSSVTGYIATTTTSRTAISSNDGLFAFDKGGTINWVNEHNKGGYYQTFNGTDSQYQMPDASSATAGSPAFTPAGNFSAVVAVTPLALPAGGAFMYIFGKYTTTGDKRSWALYYNDAGSYVFAASRDGDSATTAFATKTNGAQLGRPALLVATFNCPTPPCAVAQGGPGNNYEAKLYVDDTTPVTDPAFYGPVKASDAIMNIGRSGGGSRVNAHLHYVAYLDGVVLTQAQVTALYTKWKQANALPTGLGTGYIGQKLTIEFSAKCQFTSSTDMGANRNLVNIGSLYFTNSTALSVGGATATRNYINIYAVAADGKVYADFYSGASTTRRYMNTAAITTYNQWHKYKFYYDFSSLANSNNWVDGVAGTLDVTSMTGAHAFNITDTYVRIGQPNNALTTSNTLLGTTDGHCSFKDLRIVPAQF
jgi:hypothetical protein